MPWDRWGTISVLVVIATVVAWHTPSLWLEPLWIDEAFTWRDSNGSLSSLLLWNHADHPPLSYLLVRLSQKLFASDAEWVLRLPSYLAWLLCIPAAYWVGRQSHSHGTGLLLSLYIVLDPAIASQGLQARMWTLGLLFTLTTAAWALRLMTGPLRSPCAWFVLALLWSAGTWASSWGPLVWVATIAAISTYYASRPAGGASDSPNSARWNGLLCATLTAAGFSYIGIGRRVADILGYQDVPDAVSTAYSSSFVEALQSIISQPSMLVRAPEVSWMPHLPSLIAATAVIALLWLIFQQRAAGLIWALIAASILFGVGYALQSHHTVSWRYFIPLSTALYLALFAFLLGLSRQFGKYLTALLVGGTLIAVANASSPGEPRHDEVGRMLLALKEHSDLATVVVLTPSWMRALQDYYLPNSRSIEFEELLIKAEAESANAYEKLPERVVLIGAYIAERPAGALRTQWKSDFDKLSSWLASQYAELHHLGQIQDERLRTVAFSVVNAER